MCITLVHTAANLKRAMAEKNPSIFTPTIASTENPFLFADEAAKRPGAMTSGYEVGNQNNMVMNSYKLIHFNVAAAAVYLAI